MALPSTRAIRLSDAEHREIERDAEPRPRTATEWRQAADSITDNAILAEERAGWYGLLLEDALRLLVQRQRYIDVLQAAAQVDSLLIDTLLERTTACQPPPNESGATGSPAPPLPTGASRAATT